MKKKLMSAIALVLAATMVMGIAVFAASPETKNTASSDVVEETAPVIPDYVVGRSGATANKPAVVAGKSVVRVYSDYAGATDAKLIITAIYKNDAWTQALVAFAQAQGLTPITGTFPIKLQAYIGSQSVGLQGGFGTLTLRISLGTNALNGQTVYANILYKDGTFEKIAVPVVAGHANVPISKDGTVYLTLN